MASSLIFSMTKSAYKKLSKKEVKIASKPWITREILV